MTDSGRYVGIIGASRGSVHWALIIDLVWEATASVQTLLKVDKNKPKKSQTGIKGDTVQHHLQQKGLFNSAEVIFLFLVGTGHHTENHY